MAFIEPADWIWYQEQMAEMVDGTAQMPVAWKHVEMDYDRYGEGSEQVFDVRALEALINFNYVRVWPIDSKKDTGDEDKQYMNLFLFKPYLESQGWITSDGNFDYDPGKDEFIVEGIVYKAAGDTPIAPNATQPLFFSLILEREHTKTGNPSRP